MKYFIVAVRLQLKDTQYFIVKFDQVFTQFCHEKVTDKQTDWQRYFHIFNVNK